MQTDMSSSSEYAAIYLGRDFYGNCDGGNTNDGACGWYDCQSQMSSNQITSRYLNLEVKLIYSSSVSSSNYTCKDSASGQWGGGVARVTLTAVGKFME